MSKDNSDFFKEKNGWSVIKDNLLRCYLKPYFQKLLSSQATIFYVDCFAGKGKFDDGKDGSPLIALEVREQALNSTKRLNRQGAIEACFIDLDYADELQETIGEQYATFGEPIVLSGEYGDLVKNCLRTKRGQNVFLYIDPYGIKDLDMELFNSFSTYGFYTFEMLINFNSFGFFRGACSAMKVETSSDKAFLGLDDLIEYDPLDVNESKQSFDLLTRIAGGDYWEKIVEDYNAGRIDGYQAESQISKGYKQQLRQKYNYVLDIPIRLKPGQRPKYRMIHVSNHEDACYLMAENMLKRKDELYMNYHEDGQLDGQLNLFEVSPEYASSIEGDYITKREIVEKVRELVDGLTCGVSITKFLATFVNDYGIICNFRVVRDILTDMEKANVVDIIRNPEKTPTTGRKSKFWDEKGDHTVTIRRH